MDDNQKNNQRSLSQENKIILFVLSGAIFIFLFFLLFIHAIYLNPIQTSYQSMWSHFFLSVGWVIVLYFYSKFAYEKNMIRFFVRVNREVQERNKINNDRPIPFRKSDEWVFEHLNTLNHVLIGTNKELKDFFEKKMDEMKETIQKNDFNHLKKISEDIQNYLIEKNFKNHD